MSVLSRLGIYGLVLVAVFGIAFWTGTLVGPVGAESTSTAVQQED